MILDAIEKRMALGPLDDQWYTPGGWFYGGTGPKTKSGSTVSELNALQLAVVWACVRILSEDTASLPLHLYRRLPGGGKERAVNHPLSFLLHNRPNPEMTAFTFREVYAAHLVSWGNAYAEKEFGKGIIGRNKVIALWPITPNRVIVKRDEKKKIVYQINMTGMKSDITTVTLPKEKILHTPGLGYNGLIGYSPIALLRESIGLGMTLEEYSERYFSNGIHPSAVVTHPGQPKDLKAMREAFNEVYGGLGKSHRLMLLEEGMKIEKIGIENKDAQFLESKKYSNIDIGTRIYRLAPQQYGEYDKASTYASAEQFSIDYVTHTLRAWLVRLEQSYNTNLLSPEEQGEYFFEHLVDGLLRGDIKSRYEAYAVGRNNGWLNADEIREFENMNPMEDGQGKIYLIPLNMIPATDVGKSQEPDQNANNRQIYRERLEEAYKNLISDAVGRITRKEAQRINWLHKNHPDNGAIDEFYQEFPDYIKKQTFPVFLSFAEAITSMETELNGIKYDDFKAEIQRFVDIFCLGFASDYVETSQNLEPDNGKWVEREAKPIAEMQINNLADAYIGHLQGLTGINS
jgi:HK97 family phage portal protein